MRFEEFTDPDEGVLDFEAARDHVINQVIGFARDLKRKGVEIPANASITATRALVEVGFDDRDRAKAALKSVFVSNQRDIDVFEDEFPRFWYRLRSGLEAVASSDTTEDGRENGSDISLETPLVTTKDGEEVTVEFDDEGDEFQQELQERRAGIQREQDADESDSETTTTSTYSPAGRTEAVEGAGLDASSKVNINHIRKFEEGIAELYGRRWERTRSGDKFDIRRALRRSFETGGTIMELPKRERAISEIKCCLLVDVSQSVLDTVDRGFVIDFLHRIYQDSRSSRVFFFDTDIREVTNVFDSPSTDTLRRAMRDAELEWGGGTRIGHALQTLRSEHPEAVDHDTAVIVISDGLDVGEMDVLEDAMTWLYRRSGAVLWLNPLAGTPEYEPTCRGMSTALPYVDGLFAFTDSSDLAEVGRQIEQHGIHGTIGYEYDPRTEKRESKNED
ncbi:MAG: VWA domain-containing protein [Halobacteria archaeon]|nr:VWA domain-containing protein [Halobacteria archaeon]